MVKMIRPSRESMPDPTAIPVSFTPALHNELDGSKHRLEKKDIPHKGVSPFLTEGGPPAVETGEEKKKKRGTTVNQAGQSGKYPLRGRGE